MDENAVVSKLFENDAMKLEVVNESIDYEKDARFKKLNQAATSQVSAFLQYAPSLGAANMIGCAFRVEYPKGVAGALISHNNGYISTMRAMDSNRFVGHATFVPLENSAVALSAFTALSVVTSQYYLHQINRQLTDIQNKLDKILEFLYDDKACEIYAEVQSVYGIYQNYSSIMGSSEQRVAALNSVSRAKVIANKNIQFYYRDMVRYSRNGELKKAESCDHLQDDLRNYSQAINLYGVCSVLEILLSQNLNDAFLKYISDDMAEHIKRHNINVSKIEGNIESVKPSSDKGFSKKSFEKLSVLLGEVQDLHEDKSPVQDFMSVINELKISAATPSEYRILEDGSVYQKC